MKTVKRQEFINAIAGLSNQQKISNQCMVILDELKKGNTRLSQHAFRTAAEGGGRNQVQLFKTADAKDLRINNLVNGKPTNKELMVVDRVVLQAKTIAVPAGQDWKDLAAGLTFGNIGAIPGLANGVLTLRSGNNVYLQDFPLSAFTVDAQPNGLISGEVEMDAFILVEPDANITAELDFGVSTPANTYFRFELKGLCTLPS